MGCDFFHLGRKVHEREGLALPMGLPREELDRLRDVEQRIPMKRLAQPQAAARPLSSACQAHPPNLAKVLSLLRLRVIQIPALLQVQPKIR